MKSSTALMLVVLTFGLAALFVLVLSRRHEPAMLLMTGAVLTSLAAIARRRMRRMRASNELLSKRV